MDISKSLVRQRLIFLAVLLAGLIAILSLRDANYVTRAYYVDQDAPLGLGLIALLLVAGFWQPAWKIPSNPPTYGLVIVVGCGLTLLAWAGTYGVMWDYPLTRDEHMAVFDAQIYGAAQLSQPVAEQWREFTPALTPNFLLVMPGNIAWVSDYLPGNAMMRAALSKVAWATLLNPLLLGLGLIALYRISLRLFSDCPAAIWVSLGAYVLSAQVLVNAMTSYAMTAHLVLNLIWLGLFLKDRPWAHFLAILIGVWAIGLHQIIFHPLFAGPFILTLLLQRRFSLFFIYAAPYAAALLFWITYQALVMDVAGVEAGLAGATQSGGFIERRVLPLLRLDPYTAIFTFYNLLRLIVWMPAFVIPLCLMARKPIRANQSIALPLFAGIALTVTAMMILLPYQGHGWGYRYLHPLLGSFALLAGFGFVQGRSRDSKVDGMVMILAAAALIFIPIQLVMAHNFVRPHVLLSQVIEAQNSDFVLLDTASPAQTIDEVRNLPDLSNRPLVFSAANLLPAQLIELCRRGSIVPISWPSFQAVGLAPQIGGANSDFEQQLRVIEGRDCLRAPPD